MKEITLYREDNGQYSTSEAKQDDVSGVYVQKEHLTNLQKENDELRAKLDNMESLAFELENSKDLELDIANIVSAAYELPNIPLADIRAEAVMSIIALDDYVFAEDGSTAHTVRQIEECANRIKEG